MSSPENDDDLQRENDALRQVEIAAAAVLDHHENGGDGPFGPSGLPLAIGALRDAFEALDLLRAEPPTTASGE